MLTFNSNINKSLDNISDLAEEFKHKVPSYVIDSEFDASDYDVIVNLCVIIPIETYHLLIAVSGINNNYKINFNMFGFTEDIESSCRHIMLSDVSILGNTIVNIKNVMKLTHFIPELYAPDNFNVNYISSLCMKILNHYFFKRYFNEEGNNSYLDGDMYLT